MNKTKHDDYAACWDQLSRRENLLRLLVVIVGIVDGWMILSGAFSFGFLIAVFAVFFLFMDNFGLSVSTAVLLLTTSITLLLMALWYYRNSFPCPRCRLPFFVRSWTLPPDMGNGQQCPHCGLERDCS